MHNDLERIRNCSYGCNERTLEKIEKDILNLEYMPRIHKTLICIKDPNGEYRRMLSGKYSVIYKIEKNEIIILRIFNQKENYLNQRKFILREERQSYFIEKRRVNMMKFRTLKNSYARLREKFTRTLTEDEYVSNILEEAVEKLNSGKAVFYTEEEFWKLIEEMEMKEYGEPISRNIREKYA